MNSGIESRDWNDGGSESVTRPVEGKASGGLDKRRTIAGEIRTHYKVMKRTMERYKRSTKDVRD